MRLYRLSGEWLESALDLGAYAPSIEQANAGATSDAIQITQSPPSPQRKLDGALVNDVAIDGVPFVTVVHDGAGYRLRYHGLADFLVDLEGTRVTCIPVPRCPPEAIAQLFVDRVLPDLLPLRAVPTLHASVVQLGRACAAFVGKPGMGKSTLGAALCPPCDLVCDDAAAIRLHDDGPLVYPSYPFARLCRDSLVALGSDEEVLKRASPQAYKWRKPLKLAAEPRGLAIVYSLARSDRVLIEAMSPRDALAELAQHLFRMDPNDKGMLTRELAMLERMVAQVKVKWLRYPHRFDVMDELRAAVLADIERA